LKKKIDKINPCFVNYLRDATLAERTTTYFLVPDENSFLLPVRLGHGAFISQR
jgi:hypothetical protein